MASDYRDMALLSFPSVEDRTEILLQTAAPLPYLDSSVAVQSNLTALKDPSNVFLNLCIKNTS